NLFNSEIIGTETTLPWAVVFANIDSVPRHPVQIYESLTYGAIFLILLTIYFKCRDKLNSGFFIGLLLVLVFSARFLFEFVKMRQAEYSDAIPLSVGQMLSIPFVIAGVILLTRSLKIRDCHKL
ncbi:MAG TPA: prolipoprotein diacylglyceryl transferase, partial [Methylophaga sp.]|nr:prolipoprotein diacylglyceryl transferase [Methylophaga sp.]